MSTQTCRGPQCDRDVYSSALGLCKSHSAQHHRGRPLAPLRERGGARVGECIVDGCTSAIVAKRLCNKHYLSSRRPAPAPRPTVCTGPDCDRSVEVVKHGMCRAHAKQLKVRGDLAKLTPLEAPRGRNADRAAACTFHPDRTVYARSMCRPCYLASRRKPKADKPVRLCKFDGCDRTHHANGWCSAHNDQVKRGREPFPLGTRRPGPAKGTPSPKRGKARTNLPNGWFRKTKPVKEPAPTDPTGQFAIVDFLIPTLPPEMYVQARRNLAALGADDLLDMLGLDEVAA